MHRFEYLARKFWDIHDWAADLRDDLYALPWPLSYLGHPFNWFRYHMWWVAYNTDRISSWADDVWDRLGDIPTWYNTYWLIRKYFPLLDKTWYDITNYVRDQINRIEVPGMPSYSEIFRNMRSMFVSAYSILSETKDSIIYDAMTKMRNTYSILYETRDSIVNAAISKMRSTFPILSWSAQDFLTWMGIDAGYVIRTILDTPHDMYLWLRTEFERAYSILSETKDSIVGAAIRAIYAKYSILSENKYTIVSAAITRMQDIFSILSETKYSIVGAAEAQIRAKYSILSESKGTIVSAVIAEMKRIFSILSETKDSIIDAAVAKMNASFPILTMSPQDILKWMGIDAGAVITTILDTPHDMFMWLKKEFDRTYSILSETRDTIIDAAVSKMRTTFSILSETKDSIIDAAVAKMKDIFSILSETKDTIVDATVTTMRATYNILSHTWENIHELILDYLDTLQDWSQDPWDEFVAKVLAALPHIPSINDVIDYVCDRFESILDRIFKEGS